MRGNGERIGPQNLPTSSIAGGIWNLLNQQRAQQRGAWPSATPAVVTDPYFMYVPLLLETGASSTRSTTVTDGAATPNTVTRNGTPSTGWTSPYQTTGYWSGYFSGSATTQISVTPTISAIGTGNFTIEFFYFWTSDTGIDQQIIDFGTTGFSIYSLTSSANIGVYNRVTNTEIFSPTSYAITKNSWVHVALVRSGTGAGQTALYINGTSVATAAVSSNFSSTAATIGCRYAASGSNWFPVNGYISNLRISNTARTITVPTSPYSSDANTLFLGLQSNRFVDSSGTALTVAGSPQTTPYYYPSGFTAPTASPGAGLFNATSNYLSTPDATAFNLSGGSWTIECWIYPNGTYTDFNNIVLKRGASTAWQLYLNQTTGYLSFFNLTSAYNSTSTPIANTWNHIAAVYDGTNINLYLNGTRVLQSATGNTDFSAPIYVGAFATQYQFLGYISNVRIVKGTAVYTGAFTPPSNFVT
jgi:hypothetical protein